MSVFRKVGLGVALFISAMAALAGYVEGVEAIRGDDPERAFKEFSDSAQSGDARSFFPLASLFEAGAGTGRDETAAHRWYVMAAEAGDRRAWKKLAVRYMRGREHSRDGVSALYWANRSAQTGDPEGQYLVYQIVYARELNYRDGNGKVNQSRYNAIASRPAKYRSRDKLGYEMLYRAAQQKHVPAMLQMSAAFADNVGVENRRKFISLASDLRTYSDSSGWDSLKSMAELAKHIDTLGDSLVTVGIWRDTMVQAVAVAVIDSGAPAQGQAEGCGKDRWKLVSMRVSQPIADPEYLPVDEPSLLTTFLVRGRWEETWNFDICGREVRVPIAFEADGLGGAKYSIPMAKSKRLERPDGDAGKAFNFFE